MLFQAHHCRSMLIASLASWALLAASVTLAQPLVIARDNASIASMPTGHYVSKSYGATMGLSNIGVEELEQDKTGFVWVGTDDGLYRYDGYRFDAFGLQQGLPSSEIEALHEDVNGVLWVGTRSGLGRWNGQSFDAVALDDAPAGVAVDDLAEGPGGIWATSTQGLFVGDAPRIRRIQNWPGGEATAVWKELHSSRMWVGQWDGDAYMLAYEGGQWRRFEGPPGHPKERIDAISEDGQGRLWVRTARSLWSLLPGGSNFTNVVTPFPLDAQRGYLKTDRHGDLWVSTDHALFRLEGERWIDYGMSEGNRPLLEDREGSIWFGNQGLHRLLGRGIFHSYTKKEGLPGNVIWCVFRDREGRLWIGTDAGLALSTGERFEPIAGTERNVIRSIVEAPDGTLYMVGVPGNEILNYDPAAKALKRYEIWPDNPIKRTFRVFRDHSGGFWAATEGAGLFYAAPRADGLHFAPVELPAGIPHEDIIDVREDTSGRIWIAGQRGLAMLENGKWRRFATRDGLRRDYLAYLRTTHDGDLLVAYRDPFGVDRVHYDGETLKVVAHYGAATTQSADKVFMVGEDHLDRIWIGGGNGLDLLMPQGAQHFGASEGLVGEDICNQSFLAEPNGDIWVGTTQGLVRFDASAYGTLPKAKPPSIALMTLRLGTKTLQADAREIAVPPSDNTFEAHFAALSFVGEGKVQYRQRLLGRDTEYNVTDLRDVRYSALDPGRYGLEVAARIGEHGDWGPTASFAFEVLPAWWQTWWFRAWVAIALVGLVLLAVRWRLAALQQRNLWLEEQVARRTLEVRQANERLSDANTKLHSEIDERTAAERELHLRNEELQLLNHKLAGTQSQLLQSEKMASVGQLAAGVAHEINNPIAFVSSNLRQLERYCDDTFALLDAYEQLRRSACSEVELARVEALKAKIDIEYLREDTPNLLVESLCGIDRVEKIVRDLREFAHPGEPERQQVDIVRGIESTLNVAEHHIRQKADVITQFCELPQIEGVPSQLNQVFLNLLINAAQAIEGHGTITISTGCDEHTVWVQISDSGCGIDPAHLHRIFDPFFTTKPIGVGPGLGLSVSYGIVKEHGGTIEVASEINRGTTFTIRLPIKNRTDS